MVQMSSESKPRRGCGWLRICLGLVLANVGLLVCYSFCINHQHVMQLQRDFDGYQYPNLLQEFSTASASDISNGVGPNKDIWQRELHLNYTSELAEVKAQQAKQAEDLTFFKEYVTSKLEKVLFELEDIKSSTTASATSKLTGRTSRLRSSATEKVTVIREGGKPCSPVYFWGGGKAGSTTLAALLKHRKHGEETEDWDPDGEFLDMGKEICWAYTNNVKKWRDLTENKCNDQYKFAIDGCPRLHTEKHAKAIHTVDPHAKFLMLVRDPVDRMVSHLNDHLRRGGAKFKMEDKLASTMARPSGVEWKLSEYGANLVDFLQVFPPQQILIIHTEALKTHPQQVMDRVLDFLGAQRKNVTHINANDGSSMKGYQQINNVTRSLLKEKLSDDVALLEQAMGRKFPWNDWVSTPTGVNTSDDTTWITGIPHPLPNSTVSSRRASAFKRQPHNTGRTEATVRKRLQKSQEKTRQQQTSNVHSPAGTDKRISSNHIDRHTTKTNYRNAAEYAELKDKQQ